MSPHLAQARSHGRLPHGPVSEVDLPRRPAISMALDDPKRARREIASVSIAGIGPARFSRKVAIIRPKIVLTEQSRLNITSGGYWY
jgi:hypothetical protein